MSEPALRLLSLGAGLQSTVLALMACDGTLPKPDGAIFADTGWEPQRVYDHLDRLGEVLDEAGIPLHRVSIAPIDHVTRAEQADALLDAAENGEPDGCGPFGCRSGEPV